jgi:Ca2+-binding EF-hand superfamily protein
MRHRHVSEEHAECAVCFEALCDAPTAVFVAATAGSTRRTCAHYFHLACARSLRAREMRRCPVCRAPFDDALPVPDPRDDPGGWFAAVDANGDGKLSPGEVLEALKANVPCDWRRLERDVLPRSGAERSNTDKKTRAKRALFHAWDPDGDGFIELREICAPGGLLEYVTREFTKKTSRKGTKQPREEQSLDGEKERFFATPKRKPSRNASSFSFSAAKNAEPPALAKHPDAWFAHWDTDGSGTLDKEEVTRALVKTLRREREREEREEISQFSRFDVNGAHRETRSSYASLLTSVAVAREARRVVNAIWPVFCADASKGVDRNAFLAPDGLAEAIVANMRVGGGSPRGTESSPARRGARARSLRFAAERNDAGLELKSASRGFVSGPSRGGPSSRLLAPALARTRSAPSRGAAYRE